MINKRDELESVQNYNSAPAKSPPPLATRSSEITAQSASSATGGRRITRRVVLGERLDRSRAHRAGSKHKEQTEYVAVPRKVDVEEKITAIPNERYVEEIEPVWHEQTLVRQIPKETVVYHDQTTPVPHKRIVDEYIEEPFEAETVIAYKPKVSVQERQVEVPVPRIVWHEEVQEVPEVREIIRYTDAPDAIERVIRYTSDSPTTIREKNFDTAEVEDTSEGQIMAALPPAPHLDAGTTVNVAVPYLVPKPICVEVRIPLMRFNDQFIPVPVRRRVKSALHFNSEIFDVPCVREKPVLIVSDELKPVPVDIRIKVKERDVEVRPIDPHELSQADYHAMWMRVAADQLDAFKAAHDGKYPRGMHVPEHMKMPLRATDWEACLEDGDQPAEEDDSFGDFGPLPFTDKHPLMLSYLQNKWIQTPTTLTHGLYTSDFVNAHTKAMARAFNGQCSTIDLTEAQRKIIGTTDVLPYPWGRTAYKSARAAAVKAAEREAEQRVAQHQVTETVLEA